MTTPRGLCNHSRIARIKPGALRGLPIFYVRCIDCDFRSVELKRPRYIPGRNEQTDCDMVLAAVQKKSPKWWENKPTGFGIWESLHNGERISA